MVVSSLPYLIASGIVSISLVWEVNRQVGHLKFPSPHGTRPGRETRKGK